MPGEGASIGEVYVDILPKVDSTFWQRTQAQLGPGADRFGTQIGTTIGDRIAKGIQLGIGAGFQGSPGREQGRRTGEDFAGEFDRTVRTRLTAALRALPRAEIGASTTEAEQKIRDLRARLEELSTKRVGIDIDEAAAYEEIRALRDELNRLARESPSVRVTADTGRAAAELEALRIQIDRVKQSSGGVQVSANTGGAAGEVERVGAAAQQSAAGMSTLLAAGIALGPGIIPIAAAVTAAIAGIGVGAIGVAAGFGVAILGVSGISQAVQALGAVDQNSAKDAATLAGRQAQLASAADSVRSAEASLANTRQNGADAARRAAETIQNAQLSLAQAEQQVLRAEQDLARARESERRAEEDRANQIKDGALAQRQAAIDLTKAQQELQAVQANPAASQLQRAEAQLTFDQAQQHITDLATSQKNLLADQAQAAKVGIDGSVQVVAAQDRVNQSQEAVRKGIQALADARTTEASTARQNAFAVQQATQGVISAQRSLQQATLQAGASGSSSMEQLRQSMAGLTPEGQRFATFLYGLRPIWTELRGVAQTGLLPGVQDGITAVLPLLPQAVTLVGSLAHVVGDLASEAGHALASPYWVRFFTFIDSTAAPSLLIFGHTVGNVAVGVSGLVRAFAPLGAQVGVGLLHFAEDFAHWSTTLGGNSGFIAFLTYTEHEIPVVVNTLGNLVTTTAHLVQAAAPIGSVVLVVLRDVSGAINAIPVPILTAAGIAIIGVVTATKAWQVAQFALNGVGVVWTAVVKGMAGATSFTADVMRGASTNTLSLGGAMRNAKLAAGETQGGLKSLGSFLTGPGGLALAGAAIGFTIVSSAIAAQRQRVNDLSSAMLSLHDALNAAGGANKDTVKSIVDGNADFQRAVRLSGDYGIKSGDLVNALKGEKSAQDSVTAALDAKIKKDEEQFSGFSLSPKGLEQLNRERDLRDALKKTYGQIQDNADVNKILDDVQNQVSDGTSKLSAADKDLYDRLDAVRKGSADAATAADTLKAAQDRLYGSTQSADQAEEALATAHDRLNDSVQQSVNAHDKDAHSLDVHTAAGRANRDALVAQLKASDDEYYANIRNGVKIDEATKKHDQETAALKDQAQQLGLNAGDVDHLIGVYGQIPDTVTTQLTLLGYADASGKLSAIGQEAKSLIDTYGIDASTAANIASSGLSQNKPHDTAGRKATGGPINGPGSKTSDSIPIWASRGEFVQQASAVDYYGVGLMNALNKQLIPRSALSGFAGGGHVGPDIGLSWSSDLNQWPAYKMWLDVVGPALKTMEQYGASGGPGLGPGPGFFGPLSENVASVQNWIKAQAGKPYGWAQAGPGSFDCSGVGSAAYNLLHGHSPFSHTFSTGNEGAYFPKPGYGLFSAAWTNPGERGPGGTNVGHTAFNLAGLPFESRGGAGVVVGSGVTPLTSFAHIGHYDEGGTLQPGLTLAYNGTGHTETVRTFGQERDLQAAAGTTGPVINQTINASDGMSTRKLAQEVAYELAWQMR